MDQSPNQFSTHLQRRPGLGAAPEGACPWKGAGRGGVPVEQRGGGGRAVLEALGGRVHGEDDVQVADDLAGEPLVELLVRVQHQALLLGPLLALGHQGRVLVSLKEAGHLGNTVVPWPAGPRSPVPRNATRCSASGSDYLAVGQQGVHPLQEPGVQHVGLVHDERDLLVFTAGTPQHRAEVFVEVLARVLPVDLRERGGSAPFPLKELRAWAGSHRGDQGAPARPTLIWYTLSPFIQATKRDRVVLPAPLTPIRSKWP